MGVRELYEKKLVQLSRVTQLERDAARLDGDRGQLIASSAQTKGKITETELQIIQIDKDLSTEVSKDLRETNDKIGEFVERKVTAEDQLRRVDIRSPQDGMVMQSNVHTIGGVITAGDAIMLIVPQTDNLSVEARVNPQDIDQLQIGQKTLLRFSAFNQRTTPELIGIVSRVSADTTTDQRTGQSYYTMRVALPPEEVARLGDVRADPRHAGRSLRADRRPHHDVLPGQAAAGPVDARLPREVSCLREACAFWSSPRTRDSYSAAETIGQARELDGCKLTSARTGYVPAFAGTTRKYDAWERAGRGMNRVWRRVRRFARRFGFARLLCLFLLVGLAALRVADPRPIEELRARTFDTFQLIDPRKKTARPVRIVDLDEQSLAKYGQWPWPRTRVADMVNELTRLGAVAIGFDILFLEPDRMSPGVIAATVRDLDDVTRDKLRELPSNDQVLAEAIQKNRVVLGETGLPHRVPDLDTSLPVTPLAMLGGEPQSLLVQFPGLSRNIRALEQAAAGFGVVTIKTEHDGIVRRVPLIMQAQDITMPSLSFEVLRIASKTDTVLVKTDKAGVKSVGVRGLRCPDRPQRSALGAFRPA